MDFGAMMGPQLTKINNKFAVQITRNDQYQCFVGIGVCHPNIVKDRGFKGSGPESGCYVIRQESNKK